MDESSIAIVAKIEEKSINLEEIAEITRGVHAYRLGYGNPPQTKKMMQDKIYNSKIQKDSSYKLELRGYNITRYAIVNSADNEYISYGKWLAEPRNPKFFEGERILMRAIAGKTNLYATFTNEDYVIDQTVYIAKITNENYNPHYVLAILNSKLLHKYLCFVYNDFDELFPHVRVTQFKQLPIPQIPPTEQTPFVEKAKALIELHTQAHAITTKLHKLLVGDFPSVKINTKLEKWHALDWSGFIGELAKQRVAITGTLKEDWLERLEEKQAEIKKLQLTLTRTDNEIDKMVYALYGLSEEEIGVVEGLIF